MIILYWAIIVYQICSIVIQLVIDFYPKILNI